MKKQKAQCHSSGTSPGMLFSCIRIRCCSRPFFKPVYQFGRPNADVKLTQNYVFQQVIYIHNTSILSVTKLYGYYRRFLFRTLLENTQLAIVCSKSNKTHQKKAWNIFKVNKKRSKDVVLVFFFVNFEHISHLVLILLLLTSNMFVLAA